MSRILPKCIRCGAFGHYSHDCPTRPLDLRPRYCDQCGRPRPRHTFGCVFSETTTVLRSTRP
jgi:hypothetical protein